MSRVESRSTRRAQPDGKRPIGFTPAPWSSGAATSGWYRERQGSLPGFRSPESPSLRPRPRGCAFIPARPPRPRCPRRPFVAYRTPPRESPESGAGRIMRSSERSRSEPADPTTPPRSRRRTGPRRSFSRSLLDGADGRVDRVSHRAGLGRPAPPECGDDDRVADLAQRLDDPLP